MSEQAFKNIQLLKGIPVDQFMGTMGLFSAALSVCCGDCHTGAGTSNPKWEDDPPRKRMARNMIQMVNTLNRTSFNGRQVVTCWTCHCGQPRPAATPALDRIYSEPHQLCRQRHEHRVWRGWVERSRRAVRQGAESARQIDFSDYRPVAGVMFPFRWSYAWVSGREEYTWIDAQPNVRIDAPRFAKPAPRSR